MPDPRSFRDFYAFEQHVRSARKLRGLDMHPDWFNIPIFYLPYFAHPDPSVNKRTGFLMPTIQTDDQLGDIVSLPFFYNIAERLNL